MCGAKSFLVIAELVSRMIPGGKCIKDDAGDGLCTNVNSAFEGNEFPSKIKTTFPLIE